eukprot:283056_1
MAQRHNSNRNTKDGGFNMNDHNRINDHNRHQLNGKKSTILMITLNDLKYVSNLFESSYYNQLLSLKSQIDGKTSTVDDGQNSNERHYDIRNKQNKTTDNPSVINEPTNKSRYNTVQPHAFAD